MDYTYENDAVRNGFTNVCGIDEAGRGPLAGPVYAAAVILPQGLVIDGLNDSKKLSEKKREELFDIIISESIAYGIAFADEKEIDRFNILNATFIAMKRAVEKLSVKADFALVDGNRNPALDIPCRTIVKGDSKSPSISAASILAKVSRDRFMAELDKKMPQYQFSKHKGYPTKLHYEMIAEYGVSPVHRQSFLKNLSEHI
ncbi:MAG: ribonuclease HII [Clostridiales bacterium]|nr:ribonuclease HII [Clostridiales bacterium]